jgi:hypothetical protein
MAVAYWGDQALELLQLNPKRKNLRIICCLKDGKSAPHVIQKFGKKAKQNDRLHAKVIIAGDRAIVGSANASSNGLVEEEYSSQGLIEAGVVLNDKNEISNVRRWFEQQWLAARLISAQDLTAAQAARSIRRKLGQPGKAIELVDIPPAQLKQAPLGVLLWNSETTKEHTRAVEKLDVPFLDTPNITFFVENSLRYVRKYPFDEKKEYYAIDIRLSEDRAKVRTFSSKLLWFPPQSEFHRITTRQGSFPVVWAFQVYPALPGLPRFKIGPRSKSLILAALRRRKMRLRTNIEGKPLKGALSWEPLWELLYGRRVKSSGDQFE